MAKRSIAGEYFRGLLRAALIAGLVTGLLWMLQLQLIYRAQSETARLEEASSAKLLAEARADDMVRYVEAEDRGLEERLKSQVKCRVDEGFHLAQKVMEQNRGKSEVQIRKAVADALRYQRFFNGRGYYFADTLQGEAILYPHRPELEGTSLIGSVDTHGQRIIAEEVALVTEQGEGFVSGYWPRPQDPDGEGRLKISYVKRLEPYPWYIGSGDYYDDFRSAVRQEIIDRFRDTPPEKGIHLFLLDSEGNELMPRFASEAAGSLDLTALLRTEEGRRAVIAEELAYVSDKPGGYGYIRSYGSDTGAARQTAVYIHPLPKWDLIVGAEVTLPMVGSQTAEAKAKGSPMPAMLLAAATVTAMYLLFILALRRQTLKLRNDFIAFMAFFKRAAVENVMIDGSDLQMQEFVSMAHLANQMVVKRREANEALKQANEQLEQQVQERTAALEESLQVLENTQEQLIRSEKLSALGSVVAGITHEINVPVGIARSLNSDMKELIASVREGLRAGEERIGSVELMALLTRMEEDAVMTEANLCRTLELVRSFKEVSVDQSSGQMRRFDLGAYLNEVLVSLTAHLRKGRHQTEVICEEGVMVSGYPGALSQVVTNLVVNSVSHGFREKVGGHITLEVIEGAERVLLLYRDDGCGIPAKDLNRIYDPFFTTGSGRGGTGLGLNIVHQLVTERMGGTINVTSAEGRGVQFEIEFPRNIPAQTDV